jgi:hypothetical protein
MTRPQPLRDWTEFERGQIHRLEDFCTDKAHWVVECSHTDIGDPWCVIYDRWRQRVILHIARIDMRYVVAFPPSGSAITKPTLVAAVEVALAKLRCL